MDAVSGFGHGIDVFADAGSNLSRPCRNGRGARHLPWRWSRGPGSLQTKRGLPSRLIHHVGHGRAGMVIGFSAEGSSMRAFLAQPSKVSPHQSAGHAPFHDNRWICRKFGAEMRRRPTLRHRFRQQADRIALPVTEADCGHISPVLSASCEPSRCRSRSSERTPST